MKTARSTRWSDECFYDVPDNVICWACGDPAEVPTVCEGVWLCLDCEEDFGRNQYD